MRARAAYIGDQAAEEYGAASESPDRCDTCGHEIDEADILCVNGGGQVEECRFCAAAGDESNGHS